MSLVLVAPAIAIIMTPAAYHRLAERGSISEFFVRLASGFIAIAMLPLMIALCIEVYLLGCVILQRKGASAVVSVLPLIVFASLWYGLPFAMRHSGRGGT